MSDSPRKPASDSPKAKFLRLARDRWDQADDADEKQRTRELDDLRFYAGDQWPEDIRSSRTSQLKETGLPPVPARPCITINKTREPVRTVLNQERGADIGIEIVPADDFGDLTGPIDETEIKIREGLTRRIQRTSEAADARSWGFGRATISGRGYYGIMTRYAEGKTFDQEVYVRRFYNQASVLLDPAHEQPDGSDAEWEFVGTEIPWLRYKAEHGTRNGKPNRIAKLDDSEWRALGDEQPDWFIGEGDMRSVRVVEYFYTEREARTLCELADGTSVWKDELPEGVTPVDERTVIEKTIKWAKIDGCDDDVLEETDWPGPDMPIVKIVSEELQPYDDERRVEGMVRQMREPGQGFNVMVSKLVEMVGLTPIPALMMAEGQDEGYEQWYIAANTRTLPKLPYKQTDLEGRPAPPPFSVPREMPIGPVVQALAMFDDGLQSTSAVSDPAMGQTDASVKSAKHASLLREQATQATSDKIDNLMRSMRYEAQIINNLLYPIYGRRAGRIARIVNGQGEAETLMVGMPMVSKDGRPVPAPEGDPQAKTYQLTKDAKFNIGLKITKNFDFRRDQEAATVGELIAQAPNLMNVFGDLYFKNLDGPGHDEMSERMKVMLDPKILAMLESKKQGQDIPPEVQAKMAQAQQQIQELTAQLQQAAQIIQTEQVKAQAGVQTAGVKAQSDAQATQAEIASKERIAQADLAAKIEIAKIQAATQLQIEEFKLRGVQMQAELDAREQQLGAQQGQAERAHEVGMAGLTAAQQREAQEREQGHEAEMSAEQRADAAAGAEAQRAHESEMAERAASQQGAE